MGGDLRSPPGREWVRDGGVVKLGGGGNVKKAGGVAMEGGGRSFPADSIVAKGVAAFGGEKSKLAGGATMAAAGRTSQAGNGVVAEDAASIDADGCTKGPTHGKVHAKSLLDAIGAAPFVPAKSQSNANMETDSACATLPESGMVSSSVGTEMEVCAMHSSRNSMGGFVPVLNANCSGLKPIEPKCWADCCDEGGMEIDAAAGRDNLRPLSPCLSPDLCRDRANMDVVINAGHSMELEAAALDSNGTGKISSANCTSGVCLNAARGTAGLEQQNSAQAKGKTANAWNMPRFVKFKNVEMAVAAAKEGKTVVLDKAAIHANRMKLEGALVGKLMGRRLPFSFLNAELQKRWDRFGKFQLITISPDCFICIFDKHEAKDEVMLGGPWIIAGQIIGLDHWRPSFSPSSLEGLKSPIWIRLPFLPLLYWDEESLGRIAAKFGEPIGMDSQTSKWGRNSFARICVRMDLSIQLPKGVWIDGGEGEFFQQAEYEGISLLCFNCGRIGHKIDTCKASKIGMQTPVPLQVGPTAANKLVTTPPSHDSTIPLVQPSTSPDEDIATNATPTDHLIGKCSKVDHQAVGDWILVTRRKNKSNQRLSKAGKDKPLLPSTTPLEHSAPNPPTPHADMEIPSGPSTHSQPMDTSTTPPPSLEGSHALCSTTTFTGMDARLNRRGTSSKGKASRDRVSKAHFMKELSQLGPIAMKTRKKRKNIFEALNGEDNSLSGS